MTIFACCYKKEATIKKNIIIKYTIMKLCWQIEKLTFILGSAADAAASS